ncbi:MULTISPECIES: hypothetical protein [unclassified Streptomyces]|uniref:hypothetical protein n=1 Tax=unclassified Streptomyces TaxID=2593676 RepID=UPI00342152BC
MLRTITAAAAGAAVLMLHRSLLRREIGDLRTQLDDMRAEIAMARIEGVIAETGAASGDSR